MPRIQIDRLTLKLSGTSEQAAGKIAALVAERLAVSDVPDARGRMGAIQLGLNGDQASAEGMADQIVEGLMHELRRSF